MDRAAPTPAGRGRRSDRLRGAARPGRFFRRDCRLRLPAPVRFRGRALGRPPGPARVCRADGAAAGARLDRDEGDVAVLHDRGDIVIRRNPFDLDDAGVHFTPNAAGGYDVGPASGPTGGPATPLGLGTGEARAVALPFPFPFFGRPWTRVFVQSDGSVVFGAPDAGSGPAGLARFLSGPPRAAAFFADLDPSRAGGVSVELLGDAARVLWSDVPGAAQTNRNTFELVLRAEGAVEMRWATRMQTREAVVGISPGGTDSAARADLCAGRPVRSAGALAERFSESEKADLVSVARRFLDAAGRPSNALLGRGLSHGLMGLRAPEEVPPFFYVDQPDDLRPARAFRFSSGPEVGVRGHGRAGRGRLDPALSQGRTSVSSLPSARRMRTPSSPTASTVTPAAVSPGPASTTSPSAAKAATSRPARLTKPTRRSPADACGAASSRSSRA